jgi:hypothetical protein
MTVKMTLNAYTSCIFTNCLVAVIFGVFKEQYLKLQNLIITFSANQTPLQGHCTENSTQIFPEMKLHSLVPNSFIHVSVSDLYIARIDPPFLLQRHECGNWERGRAVSILGIHKSDLFCSAYIFKEVPVNFETVFAVRVALLPRCSTSPLK